MQEDGDFGTRRPHGDLSAGLLHIPAAMVFFPSRRALWLAFYAVAWIPRCPLAAATNLVYSSYRELPKAMVWSFRRRAILVMLPLAREPRVSRRLVETGNGEYDTSSLWYEPALLHSQSGRTLARLFQEGSEL